MLEAAAKLQRPLDRLSIYKQQLQDLGFTNVTQVKYKWPTNSWPRDPRHKELGMLLASQRIRNLEIVW